MKRRLLAFLLAFVMTFSLVPVNTFAAEADAAAHYTNITTESGENVTVEYVETVVGEAAWGQSINTPYYHVTIPEGTEKVLLTYPESVNLVLSGDDGAVFFYRNTYPGQSEINLGGALTFATNDDRSKTVTIPVERFMLSTDGSVAVGMAYYVDEENQSAAEFFDFTYAALTHVVTLTSGEGYTLTGKTTVEDGKDYSFTVTIADDYEMEDNFVVKANGETLTAGESGSYTVENVTADLTITVEGVVKKQAAGHAVTLTPGEGYTLTGEATAEDGKDYTFKLELDYRYEAGEDFAVQVNGKTVTGEKGVYTVKNVSTNLVITVKGVKEKVLEPVTVYFSFSHDDQFEFCEESGQVMALKKVTVPYFDLGLYGLKDFYFRSENYGSASGDPTGGPGSDLTPGTKEFAYGKITLLHLYIYATEVFYLGVDPADAGKGEMADKIGKDTLNITGKAGSLYMQQIWGYDENLNYYLNYEYPLASTGWGSTSDQILLHDGDIVTLGHFSDWRFYEDSGAVFNHIETDTTNPVQGDKVTMMIYRDGADSSGNYTTAHTVRTNCPDVYCTLADSVTTGDVTKWTKVGTANEDGTLVVDTSTLAPGEYIFAIPGQHGNENTSAIVGAPGGIRLTIHEKPVVKGDINGDGTVDVFDVSALYSAIFSDEELDAAVADVNGDGVVDVFDVSALYALIMYNN